MAVALTRCKLLHATLPRQSKSDEAPWLTHVADCWAAGAHLNRRRSPGRRDNFHAPVPSVQTPAARKSRPIRGFVQRRPHLRPDDQRLLALPDQLELEFLL
jgi:hypothetical protein